MHAAPVYRFCLSQVRDPVEAEDVAAEVFASGFAAYERTPLAATDVRPWLLRIARNEIIDRARRRQRRSQLLERFFGRRSEVDPSADVESAVITGDELRRAIAVIKRLPDRDRVLVGLRLAADLPYSDIAEVMGMTEHAATVATHRAVKRLRDQLRRQP